jgi:DNA-binding NarL/FixJ family response regulator/class 3 adenylate cyclase
MATTTILFTDLSRSTERLVETGDPDGVEHLTTLLRRQRDIVEAGGGSMTKTLGDGVMAVFTSCTEAVMAAVSLQQAHERDARRLGSASGLRVSVHVGDVVSGLGDDVFGLPVVVARRLCDLAQPGEVLVSDVVRHLVSAQPDLHLVAAGTVALKGIPDAVGTWTVAWSPRPDEPSVSVVVAEDSVLVRAGVVALLREEGFDVVADVGDRDELLAAARLLRPALVVTDVRMPPGQSDEGIAAASVLRAERPDIAVLVLSQHVEPSAAALLLSHNPTAVGYLLKERVSHLDEFVAACRIVAAGGVVIDALVTEQLLRRREDHLQRLTDRELEVLDLMAQGRSNAAIATSLHCSPKTLEAHIRSVFQKLDLREDPDDHRRVAAVVRYLHSR